MKQYHNLLRHVLENGVEKADRTGVGTLSCFGYQMRFNLNEGFPLVTTKKVHLKSIIHELLWFLKGDTNSAYLEENGITIWREWYDQNGELPYTYPRQWRHFGAFVFNDGIDQIKNVIDEIKINPDSRRLIVSAWNPDEIKKAALPPCHTLFQFYVSDGKLSCHLYQRSCDIFLGCPFNIASYSLLTMMIAQVCDLEVGEFVHSFGDLHIYKNHIEQVKLQLSREPRELPTMLLNKEVKSIDDFKYEDFELINYNPYPAIKAEVAV